MGALTPAALLGSMTYLMIHSLISNTCGNAPLILTSHIVLFDLGALITSACSSSVKFSHVNPGWQ